MKFGVVIFPGSNCDRDTHHVLSSVLGQDVVSLWHKDTNLQGVDMVVLPGGFSFGDYLRSGAIARFSPIMQAVIQHAEKGGLVLGICNGFQVLCEAGLLPGALLHNNNRKFICKNVHIRVEHNQSILTQNLSAGEVLQIPIAHGEGKYFNQPEEIAKLETNQQILFRYCTEQGELSEEANPNGSIGNIAGICNATKNVFGMMPHPERAADEILRNQDGKRILSSILGKVKSIV